MHIIKLACEHETPCLAFPFLCGCPVHSHFILLENFTKGEFTSSGRQKYMVPVRTDYAISVIVTYGSPFPFSFFYQLFHLIKRRQPPFSFPFTTRNIQFSSGNIGWSIWFQIVFFRPNLCRWDRPMVINFRTYRSLRHQCCGLPTSRSIPKRNQ